MISPSGGNANQADSGRPSDAKPVHPLAAAEGALVTELYDAVALPGVRQPWALGFKEIDRLLLVGEQGKL